jgi:hypothetical protein
LRAVVGEALSKLELRGEILHYLRNFALRAKTQGTFPPVPPFPGLASFKAEEDAGRTLSGAEQINGSHFSPCGNEALPDVAGHRLPDRQPRIISAFDSRHFFKKVPWH